MDIFRPGIYLPSAFSQTERSYIIRHEQHHIRRGDHIIRIFAFAALCIHWFNPLVWAVFLLSDRDMEMSCDEAVMRQMKEDIRADYSESLLRLFTVRKITVGTPLAFGEGDTKSRIRNILHYKKPVVWIVIPAILLVLSASVFLITSSSKNKSTILIGSEYMVENLLYSTSGILPSIPFLHTVFPAISIFTKVPMCRKRILSISGKWSIPPWRKTNWRNTPLTPGAGFPSGSGKK